MWKSHGALLLLKPSQPSSVHFNSLFLSCIQPLSHSFTLSTLCLHALKHCLSQSADNITDYVYIQTCISVAFPRLPLPPSWSSHCQSTPRTTRAPGKIPLAVIFLLFLRGSRSTLKTTNHDKLLDIPWMHMYSQ